MFGEQMHRYLIIPRLVRRNSWQARICMEIGAAVVVMVRREAYRYPRQKNEICARSYKLLTEVAGFPPEDIIFDPNLRWLQG